jgi:hypothetical protein
MYRNEYRNLKLAGATMGRGLGRSEEDWKGWTNWVVIHICMETTQGNSLCIYLYLKLAKMSCFFFLSFVYFSSTKSESRRVEGF